MDNVHKLYQDNDDNEDQDVNQVTDLGIVHEPAERIDPDAADAGEVIDAEVIEGEVLTDEESAELDRRLNNRGALVLRRAVTGTQVATRAVVKVGTHDRTKTAGKVVLRESFTVVQGVESWAKRAWDASTM